ncbi:MAG TPA: prephenate dehydrogenase/arogenate dehydrogenase family protein [Anaerolineales bacterium]|nr:prephenate dehydrogenase/arogenate dehydrogenase family protein [Anaerolineales bacterium]
MPVQITIIGLGQVGASIGLALKEREASVYLMGHDKDTHSAKAAQDAGAVDTTKYNLSDSVKDARIVILALPLAEVRETLKLIGPDLQEGTLVIDTAPAKGTVESWAKELIPQGRFYVGLFPAIHPDLLHDINYGVKAARADLFQQGIMVLTAPQGTPENIFNLTTEFITLLGSLPLLMDTAEADGLLSKVQILPQLASAALLDATLDQPGWQEGKKLAGKPYAAVTSGLAYHDDSASLREAALENRENVVRLLNSYIASLLQLRDDIEANDRDAVGNMLDTAWGGRIRWFEERIEAEWLNKEAQKIDAPSFGERVNNLLFGSSLIDRPKPQ